MCDIEGVGTDGVVYPVSARHLPGFVEKDMKRILVFVDVLFSFKKAFYFLGGDDNQAGATFREFSVG